MHQPEVSNPSAGKLRVSIPKYEDPTQEFTSKELKWSFWYVGHKALLYRVTLIGLMIISGILFVFSGWKWGLYLWGVADNKKIEGNLAASVDYTGMHSRFGAQPVQVLDTYVFSSRGNKIDFVAELANPNTKFLVTFDYHFVLNDTRTEAQRGFLLPGESKPVAALGLTESAGGSPSIVLENIVYNRIPNREVSDTIGWQAYRLDFQVTDFVFLESLAQEGNNVDAVQFKLTNNSPYSYVDADFYVVLLQNGQMVGILPLHLDFINSLETKNIDLRSLLPGLSVTGVSVYPRINVYDDAAYAK